MNCNNEKREENSFQSKALYTFSLVLRDYYEHVDSTPIFPRCLGSIDFWYPHLIILTEPRWVIITFQLCFFSHSRRNKFSYLDSSYCESDRRIDLLSCCAFVFFVVASTDDLFSGIVEVSSVIIYAGRGRGGRRNFLRGKLVRGSLWFCMIDQNDDHMIENIWFEPLFFNRLKTFICQARKLTKKIILFNRDISVKYQWNLCSNISENFMCIISSIMSLQRFLKIFSPCRLC